MPYYVENQDGRRAILKALNVAAALGGGEGQGDESRHIGNASRRKPTTDYFIRPTLDLLVSERRFGKASVQDPREIVGNPSNPDLDVTI